MRIPVLAVLLLGCGASLPPARPAPAPAAAPSVTDEQATAAYNAKQYTQCARMFEQLGAQQQGERKATSLYNAACCDALAGKPDAAFAELDRVIAAGMHGVGHVQADTDLASLHGDSRWPPLVARWQESDAKADAAIGDPALREELLAMVQEDQDVRMAWIAKGLKTDDKDMADKLRAVDTKHVARMKEIVAKVGWPGKSLVGLEASHGAWLLVQHADDDIEFQKLCLAKLEPLVKTGEVTPDTYAYLYDRIAVHEKRPQRYGTQFDQKLEPQPIEDEAHVDARRKEVGLPSMAEYKQQMLKMYGHPK